MEIKQSEGNVLVIEDDEDFGAALLASLSKRFSKVTLASTAEDGIKELKKNRHDAIVSDIKLPEMDGVQFLKKVREIDFDIPLIFLTGYASLETAQEALRLQASDYLLKPLEDMDELVRPLEKAIQIRKLKDENLRLNEELKEKVKTLEKFSRLVVGRQLKMIELKEKIKELEKKAEEH